VPREGSLIVSQLNVLAGGNRGNVARRPGVGKIRDGADVYALSAQSGYEFQSSPSTKRWHLFWSPLAGVSFQASTTGLNPAPLYAICGGRQTFVPFDREMGYRRGSSKEVAARHGATRPRGAVLVAEPSAVSSVSCCPQGRATEDNIGAVDLRSRTRMISNLTRPPSGIPFRNGWSSARHCGKTRVPRPVSGVRRTRPVERPTKTR